ncbi:MAG: hypothetical protein JST00_03195 [Deltaproteobacteria bacterium]|nr:hypothetical protein [Deltaproteobacteria bacterium]
MTESKRSLFGLLVAALVAACSTSDPKEAVSSSSGASGSSSSGEVPTIGRRAFPERLCDPLPQHGEEVVELGYGDTQPEGEGGRIIPGTYVLHELRAFKIPQAPVPPDKDVVPLPKTGRRARATIYVTSDALRFNEGRTEGEGALPGTDKTRGFSYKIVGKSISLTSECPTRETKSTIPFTAQGEFLILYVDSTHAEVYQRLP